MEAFLRDYLERLESLHGEIEQQIVGLPLDALDWTPGPEMNSLGVLMAHLTGSERYWIGDVIARESSGRDRESEFHVRGVEAATLLKRYGDVLSYSRGVVEKLSLGDLAAPRVSPSDGQTFTVGWVLAHVLEHTGIHLGHMELTRQLWEHHNQG
jgi:hypothetical protein